MCVSVHICMYKSLGLSLSEIKDVLSGGDGLAIISDVLDDKENSALHEIENAKERLECIRAVKRHFAERSAISPKIFFDVQNFTFFSQFFFETGFLCVAFPFLKGIRYGPTCLHDFVLMLLAYVLGM